VLIAIGSGLVQGFGLALVAFGFTLVYRANRVVNFAVGEGVVFGGYFTWWLVAVEHLNVWLALLPAVAAGALLGYLISLMLRGPLGRANQLTQIMFLVGLSYVMIGLMSVGFGSTARNVPSGVPDTKLIGGLDLTRLDVFIVVVVIVLIGAAYGTRLGADFRASASNPVGAQLMGINPRRVGTIAWVAASAAAVLAGWLFLPKFLVTPTIGEQYLFEAFAAVVIGGFGSLVGSAVGGIVLGVATELVAQTISAAYVPVVPLVLTLIVLTIRPTGIVGERA
jgi:branched-chain amino acid transport system permease protein